MLSNRNELLLLVDAAYTTLLMVIRYFIIVKQILECLVIESFLGRAGGLTPQKGPSLSQILEIRVTGPPDKYEEKGFRT